jgi:pimeloyl-ACP methyl ester carboxylesterase
MERLFALSGTSGMMKPIYGQIWCGLRLAKYSTGLCRRREASYNRGMAPEATGSYFANTDQGLVSYRHAAPTGELGSTPIVLIHGLGGASVVWERNIPVLAETHPVFAPDLWGTLPAKQAGRSCPRAGVRFLRGFMNAVGIDQAHVVGNSLGGLIAGHYAVAFPRRVRSLTLIGSAGLGREIAWAERLLTLPGVGEFLFRPSERGIRSMLMMLIKSGDVPEDLVHALYQDRLREGIPQQMLAALRSGVSLRGVKRSAQFLDQLATLNLPTLLGWGERDPLFPVAHAQRALKTLPNAQLHVFDGAGHWPHFEDSARFNGILLDFLSGVETGHGA